VEMDALAREGERAERRRRGERRGGETKRGERVRRKLLTEPKDVSRGPRSGRARVPSVDARGVSARPRTARESGGVERVASRKSPEKQRTCSLVKLLIRASGVFLLTNLAKSGCTLHRARISPNRNPEANADSNESTCCVTPTSSRSHRRRSSDIVRAAARPGVLARALLSEGSNPNESSHANPKQERARVVDRRASRLRDPLRSVHRKFFATRPRAPFVSGR
jgi:hypothetical protein